MKVLFAVNDENISTSIVKKYQKQYKEIISYKNVYYFNAILKELQRNKNYDRVVISEDLEEFTSSSLEQKDKFIFDRLDNISDEAVTSSGGDIPIILICSERRTKSEDILVKLFGIGIYNAIIGKDRSTEEVCRLINKPRSKKEAKIYYKIDSENVRYEQEDDNDVSEVEMQNILNHFKKLGYDEEKYPESFKNIVSQYNQEQLKVIIAVLPINVREVLEETSPEYRKIMLKDGNLPEKERTQGKGNKRSRKGTSEQLLEVEAGSVMTKPVVVPTTMKSNMRLHINQKKKVEVEELEDDENLAPIDEIIEEKPKKRGRPRKNETKKPVTEEKTKKRGRPRKTPVQPEQDEPEQLNILPGFDEAEEDEKDDYFIQNNQEKNDTQSEILPGFDEDDSLDYENNDYNETRLSRNKNENDEMFVNKMQMEKYDNTFEEGEFESLLTGDKKVVAFVGTSKNGTSFVVNNVAQILSNMGIDTAILDATQNKNAYYIYTKNEEELRQIAVDSISSLRNGRANGIKVNNKLTVYVNIPGEDNEQIKNSHPIMETLVKNHSLILIDCDFNTPVEYFANSQEIYLIQSMDVLTIQPLTEFLRELQIKGILEEQKLRIILNKMLKLKRVNGSSIVGGMSKYNNADLSLMKELFNPKTVKVASVIPFDEDVYIKYLENMIDCEINLSRYPKEMKTKLSELAEVVYPLLPNSDTNKKNKKKGYNYNQYSSSFSADMNDTLNNMRKKY